MGDGGGSGGSMSNENVGSNDDDDTLAAGEPTTDGPADDGLSACVSLASEISSDSSLALSR